MRRAIKMVMLCVPMVGMVSVHANAEDTAVETMQEYLGFANYEAGIILPQQLTKDVFSAMYFIDTRSEERFLAETIPGAVHLEWREVLDRVDEIPTDKKVVLFCDTGVLSAQALFALRSTGHQNVLVLQTGIEGWKKDAVYRPRVSR